MGAVDSGGLLDWWGGELQLAAGDARDQPQPGVQSNDQGRHDGKPRPFPGGQLTASLARRDFVPKVPPGPPPLPRPRRGGRRLADGVGGLVLPEPGPEIAVVLASAGFLRAPPLNCEPQTAAGVGSGEHSRATDLQLGHLPGVWCERLSLLASGHFARHGHSPHRLPLHFGALRLRRRPRNVLVLRLAQRHHVQRGLPQRAPRLPKRARLAALQGNKLCSTVFLLTVVVV